MTMDDSNKPEDSADESRPVLASDPRSVAIEPRAEESGSPGADADAHAAEADQKD